jgi:hypothetical protein
MAFDSVINYKKSIYLSHPPKTNVPDETIFSTGGFTYILPHLIGRDLINDRFKAVGLEDNIDSLIGIAISNNLSLESILENVSPEAKEMISTKKRKLRINYITNKDSLFIFENVKSGLNLKDKDFYTLGNNTIKKNSKTTIFLNAMGHNILEVADKVGILNNLKNKTKDFRVSIIEIESNPRYTHEISLTTKPKVGVKHPDYLAYWNSGMQNGVASQCRGVDENSVKLEIDEFTKEFTLKYKLYKSATRKKKAKITNEIIREFLYNKKLEELIEDGKTVEIEKSFIMAKVMAETDRVLTMMKQMRHPDTYNHQIRVAYMGLIFGKQMEISNEQLSTMAKAYPNHDNKKNATPESLLHLDRKPSEEEMVIIRAHAPLGEIAQLESGAKAEVAIICSEHQGRANGSNGGGYSETIPVFDSENNIIDYRAPTWEETTLLGNMSQIVDATDAIHCKRIYKPNIPLTQVREILKKDITKGIIQEDLGKFYTENTLETLIDLGYDESKFISEEYDFSRYGSEKEKEIINYLLGYNNFYSVKNIPEEIRYLNKNHKITIEDKEERIHNLRNYLAKLYSQLKNYKAKEVFKRSLDNNSRKYLPDDGIEAI